eukprot:4710855-Pyramimonas_sp.AAC.1
MAGFAVVIFLLLGSPDGFTTAWHTDLAGIRRAPKVATGLFCTIAFLVGAFTSLTAGFLGMKVRKAHSSRRRCGRGVVVVYAWAAASDIAAARQKTRRGGPDLGDLRHLSFTRPPDIVVASLSIWQTQPMSAFLS